MGEFVLQREIVEPGSRGKWFDAETFETEEAAFTFLRWRQAEAQHRINGMGGSGYTGGRAQRMRVVRLLPNPPTTGATDAQ